MTRLEFEPYIRQVADLLRLKDWRIIVTNNAPKRESSAAEIEMVYGQRVAKLRLSEIFLKESREYQRETIIHELLHCHFHPADAIIQQAEILSYKAFDMLMEYGIDDVSLAIAPFFPLPPE